MVATTTFVVLSALGLLNAGYLVYKHYWKSRQPLVCPLNHNCSVVTESRWSHMLGVRNEALGLLFFVGLLVGMLITFAVPAWASSVHALLLWGTILGALFSILLVLIQLYAIKDYCFYCIISAIITLLVCINAFYL